jgi:hypothetical protein
MIFDFYRKLSFRTTGTGGRANERKRPKKQKRKEQKRNEEGTIGSIMTSVLKNASFRKACLKPEKR